MNNLYNLIKNIKSLAKSEPNIRFAEEGDVYVLNNQQDIDYPAFILTQGEHSGNFDDETQTFGFSLFAVDRLVSDQSNKVDVQNWAINFIERLINKIESSGLGQINSDYRIETFTERFNSLCAGAFVQLNIQVNSEICDEIRWVTSVNGMRGDVKLDFFSGDDMKKVIDQKIEKNNENYLDKVEVNQLIDSKLEGKEVDLSDYYTKSQIDTEQTKQDTSINQNAINIDNLTKNTYSKEEVNQLIDSKLEGKEVDLTNYYTKNQIDQKFVDKFNNVYDKQYINALHQKTDTSINLVEQNLTKLVQDNYYEKSYVDLLETSLKNDIAGNKQEITDLWNSELENYYNKEEIDQKIAGLGGGSGTVDLTNYYTKSEVNALIPTDFYGKQYIDTSFGTLSNSIQGLNSSFGTLNNKLDSSFGTLNDKLDSSFGALSNSIQGLNSSYETLESVVQQITYTFNYDETNHILYINGQN